MPQQKYPVYIFIHGGSYQTGAGHMGYQGVFENLIPTGMIVVSMNYRLNVFGRLLCLREADACKFLCIDCDEKFKRTFPSINISVSTVREISRMVREFPDFRYGLFLIINFLDIPELTNLAEKPFQFHS
jgi:hypothetical protein